MNIYLLYVRCIGENVATSEVSSVLSTCKCVQEATVYGVPVPNCDGKAGMAVIVPSTYHDHDMYGNHSSSRIDDHSNDGRSHGVIDDTSSSSSSSSSFDVEQVRLVCSLNLPNYAWPLFIRIKHIGTVLTTTSTFKHMKNDLIKEVSDIKDLKTMPFLKVLLLTPL